VIADRIERTENSQNGLVPLPRVRSRTPRTPILKSGGKGMLEGKNNDLSICCVKCGGIEFEIPTTTRLQDKAQCVECGQIYFVDQLAAAQARKIERESLHQENAMILRKPKNG